MIDKGLYKCQVILLAVICIYGGRNGGKQKGTQPCLRTASAGQPATEAREPSSLYLFLPATGNRVQTLPTSYLLFGQE